MNYDTIAVILTILVSVGGLAIFIHKEIVGLRERMARLEGTVGILADLFKSSLSRSTQT